MNDFQIISKLGEGAYSIVHKARRLIDGNIYALKKVKLQNLSEKEKQNALNEVRILASVKSNYVISYKEAFFDEGENCLGIVMEYADKGDLYQKISEFKKAGIFFEESDIWRIFIQMVRGLKSLHDLKILHRDLKSANIFLFNDGTAKLGDMNVSKVARRGLGYTQTGTPYYASPEVWKDQPYDLKSDIWSLGCVLYEMTTLKPPFRAENMEGLYKKVISGQFSRIPERFSSDLWEIIKCLLNVHPESRLNSDQILRHQAILKRVEIIKSLEEKEDSNLLQTIRVPKNLLFLTERLPKANYSKSVKNNPGFNKKNAELPDIKVAKKNNRKESKSHLEIKESDKVEEKEFVNEQKKNHPPSPVKRPEYSEKKPSPNSPKQYNLDSSMNSGHNNNIVLPTIKNQLKQGSDLIIDNTNKNKIKSISNEKGQYEYKGIKKHEKENNPLIKILPYVNNEHISVAYRISPSPYHKHQKASKYNIQSKIDYGQLIANRNYNNQISKLVIVPNRKLSPIKKR